MTTKSWRTFMFTFLFAFLFNIWNCGDMTNNIFYGNF
jgi:hypothetical protein